MEAVQKTPEREAFYKKIDGENLSALWNVMGDLITPERRAPAGRICGSSIRSATT
jgi:gentisate 1,2-dioxygenase